MVLELILKSLITSKIDEFAEWCKDKYNEYLIPKAEHFEEYIERTYSRYSVINTLVFHNSQRDIKDIYVAQSLVKENINEDDITSARIDRLPVELLETYKRILITDTAGMGKSTIMKRMFVDLIDQGLTDVGIPIYIELNRLNRDHTILDEIQKDLNSLSDMFDKELLFKLIQTGGFIFFMDGYDEIPNADRIIVARDIQDFIAKAEKDNYYILTSRPENSLASFGNFQSFKIQPLKKEDAYELLSKYDMTTNKEMSSKLIDLLKSGEYSSIDEYLENPLLVSLLYAAYDHKQTIPLKKHLFYRQVYEAYFDTHDLTKGTYPHQKNSGLDIDDFNRVLRNVGYECLIRLGVQFDADRILNAIRNAKVFCGNLIFSESDFLNDLMTSVPLFTKDGTKYKWAHKSLMEYFAARFIAEDAKENQDKILTAIYKSESLDKYSNMLDIYYDIDYKGFSKNITLPLCEQFLYFRQELMAEYKNSNKHNGSLQVEFLDKNLIEERIASLFIVHCALLWTNNNVFDSYSIRKRFQKKIGNDTRLFPSIVSENKRIWIAVSDAKIIPIIRLLRSKRHNLFVLNPKNGLPFSSASEVFSSNIKKIKEYEVYMIGLNNGRRSEKQYELINSFLYSYFSNFFLSYQLCEYEISRIKNELLQRKDESFMFDGI